MANPNIAALTTITGKTASVNLANTSANTIINNAASSNTIVKVNSVIVCNTDGTTAYDITIAYYSQDDLGGTAYPIASTVSVPADASLVVINKDSQIYLEEDKSLGATASSANKLTVVASYEIIS